MRFSAVMMSVSKKGWDRLGEMGMARDSRRGNAYNIVAGPQTLASRRFTREGLPAYSETALYYYKTQTQKAVTRHGCRLSFCLGLPFG